MIMLAPKADEGPCTLKIALENLIQRLLERVVTFLLTHFGLCPKNLSVTAAPVLQ